jgi:phosphoglycerol transferase MdoB-like AlkP superfamily enzyme
MNPAHLHLLVTHLPVLGSLFGLLLLLLALVQGNRDLQRTSLWVFILAGLAAIPTYLTGRPASTLLLKLMPGMSLDAGDQHAEVAVLALVASSILGCVALIGVTFYRKDKKSPGWFTSLLVTLALLTTATMTWTASLGGKIRHTEIQDPSQLWSAR